MVFALRSASETVLFLNFFDALPVAAQRSQSPLESILAYGATEFLDGNAADLYNVCASLASLEWVKDLTLSQKDSEDILAALSDSKGS